MAKRIPPPPALDVADASAAGAVDDYFDSDEAQSPGASASSTWGPPSPMRQDSCHRPKSSRSSFQRPVNVYTTCGRHTDQFLFGGRLFTDLARAVWGRN